MAVCNFVSARPFVPNHLATRRTAPFRCCLSSTNTLTPALDFRAYTPSKAALEAMRDAYSKHYAAVSKGTCSHELGRRASEIIREARESVRLFIGAADAQEIAFFPSTFDALLALATSYRRILSTSNEVILGDATDECVRIWKTLSEPRRFRVRQTVDVSFPALAQLVSTRTKLTVLRSASVFGNIRGVQNVLEFVEAIGIPTVFDASDLLHHQRLRVQECGAEFVLADCTSIGVPMAFLYGKRERLARLPPAFGGEQSLLNYSSSQNAELDDSNWGPIPERFEVGMSCLPRIASLRAVANEYNAIEAEVCATGVIENQANYLYEQLRACEKVQVYGSAERRALFACFNVEGVDCSRVASELADHGVYVRAGFHGGHSAHADLGINGSVRIDLNVKKHTTEDMDHFIQRLKQVVRKLT